MLKIQTTEHDNIKNIYESGMNLNSIADRYNVSREAIAKILRKLSVKIQHGHTRKAESGVVLDYFEKDTEGAAYFYGLLLADGCISDRGKVSIALKTEDSYILQNLKTELKLNSEVRNTMRKDCDKYSQLCFTIESISNSLRSLGMEPRKSTKEIAPERFTNNRHFWRGLVDGDGSVGTTTSRVYLCGSQTLCTQFLEYCKSINPAINTKVTLMKGNLYRTTLAGVKAATILNELYSDCEFKLIRKYEIAEETLSRYPEVRYVF